MQIPRFARNQTNRMSGSQTAHISPEIALRQARSPNTLEFQPAFELAIKSAIKSAIESEELMKSRRWICACATAIFLSVSGPAIARAQDDHGHAYGHDKDRDDHDRDDHFYRDHDRDEMRHWYHDHYDHLPPGSR